MISYRQPTQGDTPVTVSSTEERASGKPRPVSGPEIPRIALLAAAIPAYRQRPFEALADALGKDFHVYAGDRSFETAVETGIRLPGQLARVRNRFLLGGRLLWQSGRFRTMTEVDVAILELNPRILSVWLLLGLRRVLGRRRVLWGHAFPRKGADARSDRARQLMRSLADTVVVYTETQARELRERMPGARVIAAPNALYSEAEIRTARTDGEPSDVLYVGRLIEEKKPKLLLDAFRHASGDLPPVTRLVFVGDGPLRSQLEQSAVDAGLSGRVVFAGARFERDELEPFYGRALATVSPGYVGLSIVQSLSFGVPMILARDEPHSPEIEAAVEGWTCLTVPSDSPAHLGEALVAVVRARDRWLARREALASWCAESYSIERMVAGLVAAVRDA